MGNYALLAISPVDGRYASYTSDLSLYFSEYALVKARLYIEIEYLLFLAEKKIIPAFTTKELKHVSALFSDFSLADVKKIKEIEKKIHHDVKAIEYFLQEWMIEKSIKNTEYIHIGLTSEDINNCIYSLALQNSIKQVLIPQLQKIISILSQKAEENKARPLLARTHGQPAVPTTMGKELINFAIRLSRELTHLSQIEIDGKVTGAVGTFNAQTVAFSELNWIDLSTEFIEHLQLKPHLYTTQILPPDSYVRVFHAFHHINSILLDLNADMWRYISDGIFIQAVKKEEVGSSTMPQKVNPIDFENSEGNLGIANALLHHFCEKLPISRLQRDLSDSTVKRNIGVALSHCLLAYQSCEKGLNKITFNQEKLEKDLNDHWEVVTEGIQTILRTTGDVKAYDTLKELCRGKKLTQETINSFIDTLEVDEKTKNTLRSLSPTTYIGLAEELTEKGINELERNSKFK